MRGARQTGLREARRLKPLRLLAVACTLLAVAGCSGLKFGYNRLDWIASWQLGRFVDLDPEQEKLFGQRFKAFWSWHPPMDGFMALKLPQESVFGSTQLKMRTMPMSLPPESWRW